MAWGYLLMKNIFSYWLIVLALQHFIPNLCKAQLNLVPNWSFEEYYYNPHFNWNKNYDSIVKSWGDYTYLNRKNEYGIDGYYTSDANSINLWHGTPLNSLGYQYPINGKAYAVIAMMTYKDSLNPSARNIRGCTLLKALKTGRKYRCSFYLSPTEKSNIALNKFGMLFFTKETDLGIADNESYLQQKWPNRAHIISDSVLSDTTRWYKIEQEFVADSAYSFLLIGNFFNLDSLTYQQISYDSTLPSYYSSRASYYLDAVEVIEIAPKIKSNKLKICVNDSVCLRALNIDNEPTWYINNTPITLADSIYIKLTNSTTFYLKNNAITNDSITIEVIDNTLPILPPDLELCDNSSIIISSLISADSYWWSFGTANKQLEILNAGVYWLKAAIGNCVLTDTIVITSCGSNFYIPNAFSPNGDGINDWFEPIFTRVKNFELNIYDEWGKLTTTLNPNSSKWHGNEAITGVYVYLGWYIDENNTTKQTKGTITVLK